MNVCAAPDEGANRRANRLAAEAGAHDVPLVASYLRHSARENQASTLAYLHERFPSWFDSRRPKPAPPPPPPKLASATGMEFLADRPNLYIYWQGPAQHAIAKHLAAINVMIRFGDYIVDGDYLIGKYTNYRIRYTARRQELLAFVRDNQEAKEKTC